MTTLLEEVFAKVAKLTAEEQDVPTRRDCWRSLPRNTHGKAFSLALRTSWHRWQTRPLLTIVRAGAANLIPTPCELPHQAQAMGGASLAPLQGFTRHSNLPPLRGKELLLLQLSPAWAYLKLHLQRHVQGAWYNLPKDTVGRPHGVSAAILLSLHH